MKSRDLMWMRRPVSWAALFVACSLPLVRPAFAAEPDAGTAVQVDRFAVGGNTLIPAGRIDAVLAPWRGKRNTLEELRRAAEAVQRVYAEAGFGGVVVYLPPQQGKDGTVTLTVLEGKVSNIRVLEARFHSPENIRASLPDLVLAGTPRLRRIDSQIELANENASKRVQVLLRPGEKPGDIAADLTVIDRNPQAFSVALDDTGNSRTGRVRASLGYQHANLSGNDDVLSAQYQTSVSKPSQVSVVSLFYRMPLPGSLAVIDAYLAYSNVDGGNTGTAAGNVRITGRGHLGGIRSTWLLPRLGEMDQRLSLALDRREYVNRCDIDDLPSGSCGAAGASVSVTPVSVDYAIRGNAPLSWSSTFTLMTNIKLGGSDADEAAFQLQRPGAKPGFSAFRLASSAQAELGADWQLRGRLSLQWTTQALVAGEQFGLGGAASIRGYEERELIGDKGAFVTLELGGPERLSRERPNEGSLRALAFLDGGAVANNLDAPCAQDHTRCSIAGAGLGVAYERQRFQARLVGAVALRDGTLTRKGDTRAHFYANLSF